MVETNKIDLAPWGYAPGDNLFNCMDCIRRCYAAAETIHGGHRHSTRCVRHAMEAREHDIRINEGHLVPEPNTDQAVYALLKDKGHDMIRTCFIGSILLAACLIAVVFNITP
jgi:hypothetical protein